MWPDRRLLDLFGIELPIIQAPMANASAVDMAVAVANAGGLGSYPCAALTDDKITAGVADIRTRTNRPINLNFFCHKPAPPDEARDAAWLKRLAPYYAELGAEIPKLPLKASIVPFTASTCAVVEKLAPAVVSFHFGLPDEGLVERIKAAGCKIISSATSRREALWLAERGVDAIIAQGAEAGGHRGMFLETDVATQIGTLALVHEIVGAVRVPVIAAGGIVDGRGIAASFALGASGVQVGTAYLNCPEATISPLHRAALAEPDRQTVITNVLSGRPARSILTRFVR
jgi:nitronate monooxygenase